MEEVKCFKTTTMSWFIFCYVMLSCHAVLCHVMPCRVVSCLSGLALSCLVSCRVLSFVPCLVCYLVLSCLVLSWLVLFVLLCDWLCDWLVLFYAWVVPVSIGICIDLSYFFVELPCTVLSSLTLSCLALSYLYLVLLCPALPFLFVSCPILSSGRLLFCDFLVLSCYLFRVLFFSYDCLVLFLSCISMVLPCLILGLCWHCLILVSCHFLVILCTQPKPDFSNPYPVRPFSSPASKAKALFLVLWLPYLDE